MGSNNILERCWNQAAARHGEATQRCDDAKISQFDPPGEHVLTLVASVQISASVCPTT